MRGGRPGYDSAVRLRTRIVLSFVLGLAVTIAMASRAVLQASSVWSELPDGGGMLQERPGLRWVITGSEDPGTGLRTDARAGWPLHCARLAHVHPPDARVANGLQICPSCMHRDALFEQAAEWRPLWFGLTIDTGLYAGAAYLLLAVPVAVRRAVRRRRGLCPACAYRVAEGLCPGVCSECGTPIPA